MHSQGDHGVLFLVGLFERHPNQHCTDLVYPQLLHQLNLGPCSTEPATLKYLHNHNKRSAIYPFSSTLQEEILNDGFREVKVLKIVFVGSAS